MQWMMFFSQSHLFCTPTACSYSNAHCSCLQQQCWSLSFQPLWNTGFVHTAVVTHRDSSPYGPPRSLCGVRTTCLQFYREKSSARQSYPLTNGYIGCMTFSRSKRNACTAEGKVGVHGEDFCCVAPALPEWLMAEDIYIPVDYTLEWGGVGYSRLA